MSTPDRGDFHAALDAMLPRAGAEQRVLAALRAHASPRRRFALRDGWLGGVGVSLLVAAVLGGTLAVTFGLRAHLQSRTATPPPKPKPTAHHQVIAYPSKPFIAVSSPTPWVSPSSIGYVTPFAVSFPDARDGWMLGNGCDMRQDCETAVARTTDGGHTWQLATLPVDMLHTTAVDTIVAASAEDAWTWDKYPDPGTSLRSTHDGGRTWKTIDTGGVPVSSVAVANGTVWALTACPPPGATANPSCSVRVLSSPVHSDAWMQLSTPPFAGSELVRFGARAWLLDTNGMGRPMAMARSDDGGHTWATLSVPCDHGMNGVVLGAASIDQVLLACVSIGGWPAPQEVFSSRDGGATWTLRSRSGYDLSSVGRLNNEGAPIALAVTGGGTAWMASERGTVMVTHDDGATWTDAALPNPPFGNAGGSEGITFADALHGWTIASSGMWATNDGGAHWTYQPVIGRNPYAP